MIRRGNRINFRINLREYRLEKSILKRFFGRCFFFLSRFIPFGPTSGTRRNAEYYYYYYYIIYAHIESSAVRYLRPRRRPRRFVRSYARRNAISWLLGGAPQIRLHAIIYELYIIIMCVRACILFHFFPLRASYPFLFLRAYTPRDRLIKHASVRPRLSSS